MPQPPNRIGQERRYHVLLMCTLAFGLFHAGRQLIPSTLPLIKDELGLTYTMSGLVAAGYEIGYGSSVLIGAYLASTYGRKKVILPGIFWLSLMLFSTGFATGLTQLVIFRILSGFAFGMYFGAGTSLISSYFAPRERGKAFGIHTAGMGVGRTLTPVMVGLTIVQLGWRPQFYFTGALATVTGLIFWKVVKEPVKSGGAKKDSGFQILKAVLRNRNIAVLGFCSIMMLTCMAGVSTFLPLYLKAVFGAELAFASLSVAIVNVMVIPGGIVFGLLSDRFGRRVTLVLNLVVGAVALYLFTFLTPGPGLIIGILILGIFLGTGWGVLLAYVADIISEAHRSMALGWLNTIGVIGFSLFSVLAGYTSDMIGISNVFYFFGVVSLIGATSLLALSEDKSWLGK